MSLQYHLVERTVLAGEEAGKKKFFGQVRAGDLIDLDRICTQISVLSTATKGEVALVLNGMVHCLVDYLKAGHIIRMGDLGNFRPSAGSVGARSEEEFTLHLMRRPRVLFTPGKALREMISKVGFRYLELPVKQVTKPCDREHLGE